VVERFLWEVTSRALDPLAWFAMMPAIGLAVWHGRAHGKTFRSTLPSMVLAAYVVGALWVSLEPMKLLQPVWLGRYLLPAQEVNLVPLRSIMGVLRSQGTSEALRVIMRNAALFIPFGAILPALSKPTRRFSTVMVVGLGAVVGVEGVQYLLGVATGTWYKTVDIDSCIAGLLGVAGGYGVFRAIGLLVERASVRTVIPSGRGSDQED
jgi:glycopeptide antibiotics resistance protein